MSSDAASLNEFGERVRKEMQNLCSHPMTQQKEGGHDFSIELQPM
jgi:hypothetical protein